MALKHAYSMNPGPGSLFFNRGAGAARANNEKAVHLLSLGGNGRWFSTYAEISSEPRF
jgi:hypothetical protein